MAMKLTTVSVVIESSKVLRLEISHGAGTVGLGVSSSLLRKEKGEKFVALPSFSKNPLRNDVCITFTADRRRETTATTMLWRDSLHLMLLLNVSSSQTLFSGVAGQESLEGLVHKIL